MFGRPRCREWTPLATQQLRLRSLIQVVGYNIRPPEGCTSQCSFYLTLHHTTMSAPFYTSERICSPHPKWKEIDSDMTQRTSSTNVVIRIWCHIVNQPSNEEKTDLRQDTVIQTWGVYFSGLRYIGANLALNFTSDCFKSNTLVFQMHGGYFCSYKSLKLDIIPPENEIEHGSMSSDSSGKTSKTESRLSNKLKDSRSISPGQFVRKVDNEYSKSHSPVERGFKQNFPTMKSSASLNINQRDRKVKDEFDKIEDPNEIYEHSPDTQDVIHIDNQSKQTSQEDMTSSKIDLSETAENYDLRNECEVPKYRYFALHFLKSEIRPSYNATKLQKLHLLQYAIKKKQDAVQEIKEKIYKKSAVTNDGFKLDELDTKKVKSKSKKNIFELDEDLGKRWEESDVNSRVKEKPVSNGPRLALKLNDLLSFKSKPSPFQRKEHVRLTKQLEILRFKRIILSDERDAKLANIRRLKERHAKLLEDNMDEGLELMQNYHDLSRSSEVLKETQLTSVALRELAARSHAALSARRNELLSSLHDVFYIQQKDQQTWTICDVPLPICTDENPRQFSAHEPVATGFVAQVACLTAALLNLPLRYSITLRGSNSCITDTAHKLPTTDIPLFARSGDVTLFRYGLFLLNKCIAQLMIGRGVSVTDMRPTLANLQKLLTTHNHLSDTSKLFGTHKWLSDSLCPRTQSLRSLVASERGKQNRQFNRFKDAVDGHSPQSAMNLRLHRPSRSVGSYVEDQEMPNMDSSTTSLMGSEPNIYNMKLVPVNTLDIENLKIHNSDTDISRFTHQEEKSKVIFTLGDDTPLVDIETQSLVRLSTNNGDAIPCTACMDESVKQICSEIESFCADDEAKNENFKEIHQGFDVVKHLDGNIDLEKFMEQRKSCVEIEDVSTVSCITCENNKDGDCELACANVNTDVIIIPSAEAVLETGQAFENTDEIKTDQSIEEHKS